ncbi:hypothetical protein L1987_52101 [Smallanthus sonchifolius]|uniref:Uncharacterized protein n=1 Tax=Smallanthus sonchifolius TaxID=185202 RepID=A0ACB9ESG8_9ASTR|nr:hypothetical protein L1987_52101 [Smallanthus sonchifolius]
MGFTNYDPFVSGLGSSSSVGGTTLASETKAMETSATIRPSRVSIKRSSIELDEMLNQKIEVEVQFLAMLKAIEYFKAVESTIRVSLSPIGSTIPSDSENGDEELLQRDQGNESEGRAEAREADASSPRTPETCQRPLICRFWDGAPE